MLPRTRCVNLYRYVDGVPTILSDPLGLQGGTNPPGQHFDPRTVQAIQPVCPECLVLVRPVRFFRWIADSCRPPAKSERPDPWSSPDGRPGPEWERRGGEKGSWVRGERGKDLESVRGPDDSGHGPHYDYQGPDGRFRIYPGGRWERK
jgi:hypothetical protein